MLSWNSWQTRQKLLILTAFDLTKEQMRGDSMSDQMRKAFNVQQRKDGVETESARDAQKKMMDRLRNAYNGEDTKF